MEYSLERIALPHGGSALQYRPGARVRPIQVVLTHGITASAAGLDILSSYLAAHGFQVLAPDLPGHNLGCSGGSLPSFQVGLEWLDKTCDWAQGEDARPVVVGGHSFGGALSIVLASRRKDVAGAFAVAVGASGHRDFTSPVGKAMREARSGYVHGASLSDLTREMDEALSHVTDIGHPFLAIGARHDAVVPRIAVESWPQRLTSPVDLEWVDAIHLDAPVVARVLISRWLETRFERE